MSGFQRHFPAHVLFLPTYIIDIRSALKVAFPQLAGTYLRDAELIRRCCWDSLPGPRWVRSNHVG